MIPEGGPTPSGWPAAVAVVPTAWNTTATPALYTLQPGDSLSGLASTYLGAAARWREIWDMQPQQYRWTHSPDVVYAGEVFRMPDEARDNFLSWKRRGAEPGELPGDQPAPAPLARLRGRYRYQFLVKGPAGSQLHDAAQTLAKATAGLPSPLRASVDVDPVSML